jgi:hypothetical protein
MTKTLATGYTDLDDAVEMIVRHKYPGPGIILRDDGEEAFRELCKLVLDKRVHPRGQTVDGKTFKAGRDQFIDLQERYIFMAAALRYPAGVEGLGIEGPPSYELFDADGNRYRHARLVFRESEIETAFGMVEEPGAKPADDEAPDDIETECNAWLAALPQHPRLTRTQARTNFNRREANCEIISVRAFLRAWRESAHPSWHARGRPPGT